MPGLAQARHVLGHRVDDGIGDDLDRLLDQLDLHGDETFDDIAGEFADDDLRALAALLGRDARAERLAAMAIGAVMALAGLHTLYDLAAKIITPRPIEVWALGFSAGSAVVIAVLIVGVLWRFRGEANPVIKATWLSSRNDVISTTGFALLGLAARVAPVRWPEYLFDVFVAGLCFQASWAIWRSLRPKPAEVPVQNKAATAPAAGL